MIIWGELSEESSPHAPFKDFQIEGLAWGHTSTHYPPKLCFGPKRSFGEEPVPKQSLGTSDDMSYPSNGENLSQEPMFGQIERPA